jgi:hypothetical protein
MGRAVDIMALSDVIGQHLVLGQDIPLFNSPAPQRLDYLQYFHVQVSFTPDIAAAAHRAVPEGVHEFRGEVELSVQFGQGCVQKPVTRVKIVPVSDINRALPGKPAAFYIVKVDQLAVTAPYTCRRLMLVFFDI